jgi:hypothetical protein
VDESSHRVSDAEREQKVLSLRDHLLAGRLTLDEFSERIEIAYAARTGKELVEASGSLPDAFAEPLGSRRRPRRATMALFSHVAQRGRLRLCRRSFALSAFADLDLDLREAEVDHSETIVSVLVGFGNVDVYVPEGVNVDVDGLTVFGHRREWGRDIAPVDAPTIHIRALGCFGTIDVWRVPHQMRGSYSEITRQLQNPQRELPPGWVSLNWAGNV